MPNPSLGPLRPVSDDPPLATEQLIGMLTNWGYRSGWFWDSAASPAAALTPAPVSTAMTPNGGMNASAVAPNAMPVAAPPTTPPVTAPAPDVDGRDDDAIALPAVESSARQLTLKGWRDTDTVTLPGARERYQLPRSLLNSQAAIEHPGVCNRIVCVVCAPGLAQPCTPVPSTKATIVLESLETHIDRFLRLCLSKRRLASKTAPTDGPTDHLAAEAGRPTNCGACWIAQRSVDVARLSAITQRCCKVCSRFSDENNSDNPGWV